MIDFSKISLKELAMILGKKFKEHGIDCTLVGGACVSIYSENKYQSYDLDYVTFETVKTIGNILLDLGFFRKNRYFVHEKCPFYVDLVSPPVALGNEPITKFSTLKSPIGEVKLLTPTDCVKDRLAGFYHWNDLQAFEQAIIVSRDQKIDLNEIKRWSVQEECISKFEIFKEKLNEVI